MGCMVPEVANETRAKIHDLDGGSAKQALYSMVEILKDHPSVLMNVFRLIIEDAEKLSKVHKENAQRW